MFKQRFTRGGSHAPGRGGRSFHGNHFSGGRRSYGNSGGRNFSRSRVNPRATREVINAIRALQIKPVSTVKPEAYVPAHAFSDFPISEELKGNVIHKGYSVPTPIQDQAIMPILEGRDLIGIANTGTGKTAAFLIPTIEKVCKNRNEKVIIMAPTRELAVQIKNELFGFTYGLNVYSALLVGGMNMARQRDDLRRNPAFVIGTPGRIKDLSERGALRLNEFRTVILDEADRMVDIGFIGEIKYFLSKLPVERQSLFFSATVPVKVKEILNSFVKNPVTVSVKTTDTVDNIKQEIINVDSREGKLEQLQKLLIQENFVKVLIFGRTKWGMQKLSDELVRRGFRADVIHGNKKQGQRMRVLDSFKRNDISILLATDIASRGLDIPNVSHVINYDVPQSYEDYIHRIGRTGRADKTGTAITFVEEQ